MDPSNTTSPEPNVATPADNLSVTPVAPVAPSEPVTPVISDTSTASTGIGAPAATDTPAVSTAPSEPVASVAADISTTTDMPAAADVQTVTPVAPVNASVSTPTADVSAMPPVNADVANAALNPPVNPVVTPGANPVVNAGAAAGGTMSMNQMFQTQPAANANVFDETTAIAVPEGPKAPDPVEEELKAPLKAAGPVPGSIGSAVSVPSEGGAQSETVPSDSNLMAAGTPAAAATNPTPSPQAANPNNPMAANPAASTAKKSSFLDKLTAKTKMDKKNLIILCSIAGVVLLMLIIVLILVATGAI